MDGEAVAPKASSNRDDLKGVADVPRIGNETASGSRD
jgi:hypothetical protein